MRCTLTGNSATVLGGGFANIGASPITPSARNCNLWGDVGGELFDLAGSGGMTVDWCDVQGGAPAGGAGNIDADPLFISTANHDFHLFAASPCIDAGDPTETDPAGSRVDMGAFPFECGAHAYCVGKTNSLGCIPSIGASGTPSISGSDDFHVTCSEVRKNSRGLLLWSRGADAVPLFLGTLCVGAPFRRLGAENAGGSGIGPNCTGQFDVLFSHAYMALNGVTPFETLFAQWYMRDPLHPDGTGVGLSNGLAFAVCP